MSYTADHFKDWMDQRGLSAADVAAALGTEEQTIRKWRSQGVPERRRPHVERYMAEWTDPATTAQHEPHTSIMRIEFDDAELDDVSTAAQIVDTPIREFIRRAAVHQARAQLAKETERPTLKVAEDEGNPSSGSTPAAGVPAVKYPQARRRKS